MEEAWDIVRASGVEMHGAQVGVIDPSCRRSPRRCPGRRRSRGVDGGDYHRRPRTRRRREDRGRWPHPWDGECPGDRRQPWQRGDDRGGGGARRRGDGQVASYLGRPLDCGRWRRRTRSCSTSTSEDGKAFTFNTMAAMLSQIRRRADGDQHVLRRREPGSASGQQQAAYYKLFFERMYAKYPGVVFVAAAGNEGDRGVGLDGQNYFPGGIAGPQPDHRGGSDQGGRPRRLLQLRRPGPGR